MAHCGCTVQRRSIYDYFQHACCRVPAGAGGFAGEVVQGEDGACAQFFLEIDRRGITTATYKCTSCVTLVALCEHVAELVAAGEERITPERLLRLHPEIPPSKRERAELAAEALRAAMKGARI